MILIFSLECPPRLQYITNFIFTENLKVSFDITSDKDRFLEFNGVKINYNNEKIASDELIIPNCGLLFETGIKQRNIDVVVFENFKIFFHSSSQNSNGFPFDIFSASFYLLSRYEEYLPHEKDKYGRYSHKNSLAWKEKFLHLPLINTWINYLKNYLQRRFKEKFQTAVSNTSFSFIPTYDVDIAYAYLQKEFSKNLATIILSFFTLRFKDIGQRLSVLSGIKKDPYDNFDWLDSIHQQYKLKPVYFFLVPEKNALYDKNILPHKRKMQQLIFDLTKKYTTGVHPSWQSGDDFLLLNKEKKTLESLGGRTIEKSRQHYLRFNLPGGYRRLLQAKITEDYSMGYGAANGFRASVASCFLWYDLEKEEETSLRIYPFCYMDSNAIFHENNSCDEALKEIISYYNICKEVNGTFISIFHNHLMGYDNLQWRNVYERFLNEIKE